jgi:ribonuclease R
MCWCGFEVLGPDHYEATEDELSVVGLRSGDRITLGDRMLVEIEDVAVLRRMTLARRVVPEHALRGLGRAGDRGPRGRAQAAPGSRPRRGAASQSRAMPAGAAPGRRSAARRRNRAAVAARSRAGGGAELSAPTADRFP